MNAMKTPLSDPYIMICSVGGNPVPIAKSIAYHKPRYLIYVVSPDSNKIVKEIENLLDSEVMAAIETYTVMLDDYQDLLPCIRNIREGVGKYREWKKLPKETDFLADITGGSKVMSSALTLAMMEFRSRFSYVGGDKRTKDGLGLVESGSETIIGQANPWDVMAYREARDLVAAFNRGQFGAAVRILNELFEKEPDNLPFYVALKTLVEAYAAWDTFDYSGAKKLLRQALGQLRPYATSLMPKFQQQLAVFQENYAHLERLEEDAKALRGKPPLQEGDGDLWIDDLLANAWRRGEAGRYDDAVARLYSVIEKMAKIALARRGRDNSHITADEFVHLPEEVRRKHDEELKRDGFARLPLEDSMAYLLSLEDPVGVAFAEKGRELKKGLQNRNQSLLAHGYRPVGKKDYEQFFSLVLDFTGRSVANLPHFPTLHWSALLL